MPAASVQAQEDAEPESTIIVTSPLRHAAHDVLGSTTVLRRDDLQRALRASLGDTLATLPGMSATSFGPAASRPVLRGQQGERVRVLLDGIGSIDVSNTSADHAVAIDPLNADRIEVLRGPATLLYGPSAIGGVINVVDRRLPEILQETPISLKGQASFASAADDASIAGSMNARLGGSLIAHLSGSWRKTGDLAIPGQAESRILRATEAAGGDGHDGDAVAGRLANSDLRTHTVAAGLSSVGANSHIGVVVSRYGAFYGVPGHTHDEGHGTADEDNVRLMAAIPVDDEGVRIRQRQTRVDVKAGMMFDNGMIERVALRYGWARYTHRELEGGATGTLFRNRGQEGRLEIVQMPRGRWRGVLGAQFAHRLFDAVGAEAFVPRNTSRQLGLFSVQEWESETLHLELGARLDHVQSHAPTIGVRRAFTTFSASAGVQWQFVPGWRIGLTASRNARAPSPEELFANGPHAATSSFEIGDPDFHVERARSLEANLRGDFGRLSLKAAAYLVEYDNFITDRPTGATIDDLPVFRFTQANARFRGVEIESTLTILQVGSNTLMLDLTGDLVRARDTEAGTPLPRIPAARLIVGLEWQSPRLDARVDVQMTAAQSRRAPFELPTEGHAFLNATLAWRPLPDSQALTVMVQAANLANREGRLHASYLKDLTPLPGRDIRLSVRAEF